MLKNWMSRLFARTGQEKWDTGMTPVDDHHWRVLRSHIERALEFPKNSTPGPDGIPALAYKMLGPLAVDVLFGVLSVLCRHDAVEVLTEAYASMSMSEVHAFNHKVKFRRRILCIGDWFCYWYTCCQEPRSEAQVGGVSDG